MTGLATTGGGGTADRDPRGAGHPPEGGLHHEPHLRHLRQPRAAHLHLLEAQRRGECRVTHLVGENLQLTWVLEVPSSCLGGK